LIQSLKVSAQFTESYNMLLFLNSSNTACNNILIIYNLSFPSGPLSLCIGQDASCEIDI
jgi:hypothetical protein